MPHVLSTMPQGIARKFDATQQALQAALERLPELSRPHVYTAEDEAAVEEAKPQASGVFVNNMRFEPLEAAKDAAATTLSVQYGQMLFTPWIAGGWTVCFSRSTRTHIAGFPLMLVHGEAEEAGRLVVFPSLAQAATCAMVHAADGTQAEARVRANKIRWSPFTPVGFMVGTFDPVTPEPAQDRPHEPAAAKPDVEVIDGASERRRAWKRAK